MTTKIIKRRGFVVHFRMKTPDDTGNVIGLIYATEAEALAAPGNPRNRIGGPEPIEYAATVGAGYPGDEA